MTYLNNGSGGLIPRGGTQAFDPRQIILADLNHDGKLDAVIANGTNDQVLLALGNGDGTFQTPVATDVPGEVYGLAVADLSGDGVPDVVATLGYGGVAVLLSTGTGKLNTPYYYDEGSYATSVAVGDFNGDGHPDIAVGDYDPFDNSPNSNRLDVLLNNGNGIFRAPASYTLPFNAGNIATGDFSHNGRDDLVVAGPNGGGGFVVMMSKSNGSFQAPTAYYDGLGDTTTLAVGDVDHDGNLDIIAGIPSPYDVLVYTGDGKGGFTAPPLTFSAAPYIATIALADLNGDGYLDLLTSSSTSPGTLQAQFNTLPVSAASFAVSAPGSATAGQSISVTVTAKSLSGTTLTSYTGTVHFTSTDGQALLPADVTFLPGDHGVKTFTLTLKTSGPETVSVTDTYSGVKGTSNSVNVSALAATHLGLQTPPYATAGSAFTIAVKALDQYGNIDPNYSGTVHLSSSDAAAALPPDATLANGYSTFSVTLDTEGNQTLSATEVGNGTITGTSSPINVSGAAATHLAVSAPSSATPRSAFTFTVTALDRFGNVATNYRGTVHFTSTDAAAALPANATLTNGTGTFHATLGTAGTQTLTATATSNGAFTGTSGPITATAGPATHFGLSVPAAFKPGSAFNLTVKALDQFGNVDTHYSGTVHFTSSDGTATLPADATLTNGVGAFSATLSTQGNQTLSATDTVTSAITGGGTVDVTFQTLTVLPPTLPAPVVGEPYNQTVSAANGTGSYTFQVSAGGLPAGLSLDAATGAISGTPAAAGSYQFTITAADGTGAFGARAYSWTINSLPPAAEPPGRLIASGMGPGADPRVNVYDASTGALLSSFDAFDPSFRGGVSVAVGDVNGDGVEDVIVGVLGSAGADPHVEVIDGNKLTDLADNHEIAADALLASFDAFDPGFHGGVSVAAGRFDGSGRADVVVGAGPGAGPSVRVFSISGGAATQIAGPLGSFFAFAPQFAGGVTVASAASGGPEDNLVVGVLGNYGGSEAGPHVEVFSGSTGGLLASFCAFDPGFQGGVRLAAGAVTGDSPADIIIAAGPGADPRVEVIDGSRLNQVQSNGQIAASALAASFDAFASGFRGGANVASAALDNSGHADILVAAGPGAGPNLRALSISGGLATQVAGPLGSFYAFDPAFLGGLVIAAELPS